jgi:Uma2 family endonuclease
MATIIETTRPQRTARTPIGDQCVVMGGVGWQGYETILRFRGERRRPKMVYLDGDLYLMSPAYSHELLADRLALLVFEMTVGLDLPCKTSRSTTFRRQKDQGGAEADASFYLSSAHRILGNKDLDLNRDPPPDLTIEAVNTHDATEAVEVWRRFAVAEVWVADLERLQILALQPDGRYAEQAASVAFPFLTAQEIFEQVTRDAAGLDSDWLKQIRRWVAGPLAERVKSTGRGERPEA